MESHHVRRLFVCLEVLAIGCVLLWRTVSGADSCLMYHKRATVNGVCGSVANIAGEKLSDAEITLTGEGGTVLFDTKSDSRGSFSFRSTPEGNYRLHVKATGYREAQRDLRVSHSDENKCKPKIDVKLGFRVCDTGTYIRGVDKPSDLDADSHK